MAQILISQANADALMALRKMYGSKGSRNSVGRAKSREIFSRIKQEAGISPGKKIVVFIENKDNPLYRIIRDANTKIPLDDGREIVPEIVAAESPAAKAPVKAAAKPKAPVKAAAKPKAPVKAAAKPAAIIDVRITVDGKRIRIGKATSEAHKAKIIAQYKRQNGL